MPLTAKRASIRALAALIATATALPSAVAASQPPPPSSASAPAGPPSTTPEVRFTKNWGRGAQFSDLGGAGPYYPAVATNPYVDGVAIIACHVSAGGALGQCALVSETPLGCFFGAAALKMAVRGVIAAAPGAAAATGAEGGVTELSVPFHAGFGHVHGTRCRVFRSPIG